MDRLSILQKNLLINPFDTNEFVSGELIRKFSTNFNTHRHWDYVVCLHRAFYSLGGTPDTSLDLIRYQVIKLKQTKKTLQSIDSILVWSKEK